MRSGLYKLTDVIENAQYLGIDTERLADAAARDPGIAEFCRFYIERRAQEMAAAGDDARKRKKLEDDFTPRLELTVVALEGNGAPGGHDARRNTGLTRRRLMRAA